VRGLTRGIGDRRLRRWFALLLLLLGALPAVRADEAAALAALRGGAAVVALMRHADAPGTGDPPGWRLDDCATQRNLSERGKADARAMGQRLKAERIRFAKVLSSPWCRCVDTATLMDVGPVQIEATFSNAFVLSDRREALTAGARKLIRGWRGPGALLVVTHGANIQALTGRGPASGEVVVVSVDKGGSLTEVGSLIGVGVRR
jgi:phosphohistidine phosphatase SixA